MNFHRTRAERTRELRRFLRIDIAVTVVSTGFLVAVGVTVSESPYVLMLAGCTTASALCMAGGLRPLNRGDIPAALQWVAVANWGIAIIATAVAPFGMPILIIVALLPAALAVPFVDRQALRRYVVVTAVVVMVVVQLGTGQQSTGIENDLPTWVPRLTTVLFTPVMAGLVAVVVYQSVDALGLALQDAIANRDQLAVAQTRIVTAADDSRRQIERDLHDGAQQRLTALAIGLGRAHAHAVRDGLASADELAVLREHLADARAELRRLAHGLYPSSLAVQGLESALRGEADRIELPVEVSADLRHPVPDAIAAATYFCCLEAIQNALKHSDAATIRVEVRTSPGGNELEFEIADDGRGFELASAPKGHGFDNMRDRVGAFGGLIDVVSAVGEGTTVWGRIPLEITPAPPA